MHGELAHDASHRTLHHSSEESDQSDDEAKKKANEGKGPKKKVISLKDKEPTHIVQL